MRHRTRTWTALRWTLRVGLSLLLAVAAWIGIARAVFRPDLDHWASDEQVSPHAEQLASRYLELWSDPDRLVAEQDHVRTSNPEWDFMGRTFLVLALADMALHEPARQGEYLNAIDAILEDTLAQEEAGGVHHFLMAYSRSAPFVVQPARSQFVDGEIALMLGARRMVQDDERWARLHQQRVETIAPRMMLSPVLSAESYPDECWTFCNVLALASIRMADVLDGSDHTDLLRGWVAAARENLVDEQTGLLVSSYTVDGQVMDGPEGSTIFMVANCLRLIDEPFANDQYARARAELGRTPLGFGFAREWPVTWEGPPDVDSGPTVPLLEANAGASGLALVGAAAFDDDDYLTALLASLRLGAFPMHDDDGLAFAASNHVGDAVLLYALVEGPLMDGVLPLEAS
jgi:hypothetical protein